VGDQTNSRVQKFTSAGAFVSKFGAGGTGNGQFVEPYGIAIDSGGNFWVVDHGNERVEAFNISGT